MKHVKLFEGFLNESATFSPEKLGAFLDKFPDNATSWSQATSELPDMYEWITSSFNQWREDEPESHLKPVGRDNCKTPSDWNKKYKEAILIGLNKFNADQKNKFAERFKEWIK